MEEITWIGVPTKWSQQFQTLSGLFVVASPIGNLEDMSLRGLQTLAGVDGILCEDTRVTKVLLARYGIQNRCYAYHRHTELSRLPWVMDQLRQGKRLALLSDGGTPLISDPGSVLVKACLAEGIAIHTLPGPCAAVVALTVSGVSCERFFFQGFLPRTSVKRRHLLQGLAEIPGALVVYEAPHRLEAALKDILAVLGNRSLCLARELTKKFEMCLRGSVSHVLETVVHDKPKGEMVLVIEGEGASPEKPPQTALSQTALEAELSIFLKGPLRKSALQATAQKLGLSATDLYQHCLKLRTLQTSSSKPSKQGSSPKI